MTSLFENKVESFNKALLANPLISILIIVGSTFLLHHHALQGGWRYDDGPHLLFTLTYSPWEYFFIPDVMRAQSWANLTPWNPFFYEIGLPLFGLNPTGHYVHLLLVIAATGYMTFRLLSLWWQPYASILGALLFLVLPVTGAVGQMLMTGHYVYGLLFTLLAFYFFTHGVSQDKFKFAVVTAIFYGLACLSKELYVPIVGLFVVLPIVNFRKRFIYVLPVIVVAIAYTLLRIHVLDGVGGYGKTAGSVSLQFEEILNNLAGSLFGNPWLALGLIIYVTIGSSIAVIKYKYRINWLFLFGVFTVLFLPLIGSLSTEDFSHNANLRLLYFISWAMSLVLAWLVYTHRYHVPIVFMIIVTCAFFQQQTIVKTASLDRLTEAQNDFLLQGSKGDTLIPFHYFNTSYLENFRKAIIYQGKNGAPKITYSSEQMASLPDDVGGEAFRYHEGCKCVKPIGFNNFVEMKKQFRAKLEAGKDIHMKVFFAIEDLGFRKKLSWKFEGPNGNYQFFVDKYLKKALPSEGEINFAATGFLASKDSVNIYIHLESPEGWIARTPMLAINPSSTNEIGWEGKSQTIWATYE